jgi:hypothetical protein
MAAQDKLARKTAQRRAAARPAKGGRARTAPKPSAASGRAGKRRGAAQPDSTAGPRPRLTLRAAGLTPDQEATARRLLVEGATFEDVILTIQARGQKIAQHAVENYFRSHPELHALRAQRLVEIARDIRRETQQGDPDDVEFADAVVMTGLLRLNRAAAMLDVNDALRRKYERENLQLKQQILLLKARREEVERDFYRARTRLLTQNWKIARNKLKEARDKLARAEQGQALDPQIIATLQEVYGLVQAPPIPPIGAPEIEPAPAP